MKAATFIAEDACMEETVEGPACLALPENLSNSAWAFLMPCVNVTAFMLRLIFTDPAALGIYLFLYSLLVALGGEFNFCGQGGGHCVCYCLLGGFKCRTYPRMLGDIADL